RTLALADAHVLVVEVEERQEVDEIGLHEAQAAQVVELLVPEAKHGKRAHFLADRVEVRAEIDAFCAALELVFDLRAREVMQDHLHHGELVEVGVEQRLDDHRRGIVRSRSCAAVTRSMPMPRWWRCNSGFRSRRNSSRATTSAPARRSWWCAAIAKGGAWRDSTAGAWFRTGRRTRRSATSSPTHAANRWSSGRPSAMPSANGAAWCPRAASTNGRRAPGASCPGTCGRAMHSSSRSPASRRCGKDCARCRSSPPSRTS